MFGAFYLQNLPLPNYCMSLFAESIFMHRTCTLTTNVLPWLESLNSFVVFFSQTKPSLHHYPSPSKDLKWKQRNSVLSLKRTQGSGKTLTHVALTTAKPRFFYAAVWTGSSVFAVLQNIVSYLHTYWLFGTNLQYRYINYPHIYIS